MLQMSRITGGLVGSGGGGVGPLRGRAQVGGVPGVTRFDRQIKKNRIICSPCHTSPWGHDSVGRQHRWQGRKHRTAGARGGGRATSSTCLQAWLASSTSAAASSPTQRCASGTCSKAKPRRAHLTNYTASRQHRTTSHHAALHHTTRAVHARKSWSSAGN